MHKLLKRQLKKNLINVADLSPNWKRFISQIDDAYSSADEDRNRLERTLELSSEELNQRNLNLSHQVKEREHAEELLRLSNSRLTDWVTRLEQHNQQMALLNKMSDMLLACDDIDEIFAVIADSLRLLFSGDPGNIAIYSDQDQCFNVVAQWPQDTAPLRSFSEEDCWALRRAKQHMAIPGSGEISTCTHLNEPAAHGYICTPLIAQGEMVGVLTLLQGERPHATDTLSDEEDLALKEARRQLVQTASEHIGLAVVNIRLRESLRLQSLRDPMTGLFNRRHMEAFLKREFLRAHRQQHPISLMMIDVDHFKRFNDNHGHQAGDELLIELARYLQQQVRGEDIACRYGGEEFILILPGAEIGIVAQRAERLRVAVAETMRVIHEGQVLPPVTLSIGIASFPQHGTDIPSCIRAADAALYGAKNSGRNRVEIASQTHATA